MESAVWILDILMECHEEFVGSICTLVTMWEIGTSVDLRRICIQRMRPTG